MITGVDIVVGIMGLSWILNAIQVAYSAGLTQKIERLQREHDVEFRKRIAYQREICDLYEELGYRQTIYDWPIDTSRITTSAITANKLALTVSKD